MAFFRDAAVLDDKDTICIAHGGDAMRDQDRGAALHRALKSIENALFGQRVYTRQRVIQNQNGRFRRMARAIAVRCFWPPESVIPRSPTIVS